MPRNALLKGLKPMHPGEHLREDILPAIGKSRTEIARLLGVSRQTVNAIEQCRYDPSLPLAIRIARYFGTTVEEMFHVDGD
mgnify:CR=1 FL=1